MAIRFEDVAFSYGGRPVLNGVTLDIPEGGLTALMGSNGSGKSTLLLLACGLLQPDRGSISICGHSTAEEGGFVARQHCGFVFQNPDDQLVASVVRNEVAFGPENLGLPREEIEQRVTESLAQVGLAGFEDRQTHALSGGQKQRLALAGALAMRPRVLLLDEASSMLDPDGGYEFMRLIRSLANKGMTVVMSTHSPREAAMADRVVRLEEGAVAFVGSPLAKELGLQEDLVRLAGKIPDAEELERMRAEELADARGAHMKPAPKPTPSSGHSSGHSIMPIIQFDDVSYRYEDGTEALADVSLTIELGEFVAVVGSTGSGKSTLIQHMNGLLHPTTGRVVSRWNDLSDKHAANEARFRIGLVFQYPEQQLFAATVYDDVAFGPRNLGLGPDEAEMRVKDALAAVGLSYDELNARSPFQLSGGQQRRVAIAGVLAMQPDVLVMDEPCAGLDPEAHERMRELLRQLHESGQTIVMVSHNMEDVADLATRVIRIDTGRVSPA